MIREGLLSLDELDITPEKAYAAMGYGGNVPEAEVRGVVDDILRQVTEYAKPSFIFRIVPATVPEKGLVCMGGRPFRVGGIIGSYLPGMDEACVFVATAGNEYDRYLSTLKIKGDILSEYVADAIGSVIAEACVDYVDRILEDVSSKQHSLPYSPGYCAWNIKEQRILFPLLPPNPCGVTLSDSCLMSPVKSVSGFFALGDKLVKQPYKCDICTNKMCYKRRLRK